MTTKYMYRILPKGEGIKPVAWSTLKTRLHPKLAAHGPHNLTYGGERYHKDLTAAEVEARLNDLVHKQDERVIVHRKKGDDIAVRSVKMEDVGKPIPTVGTPVIDRIVGATRAQFAPKFAVVDMGICRSDGVGSASEHWDCNAWDAGVNPGLPADEIHKRITNVATWLKNQGQLHIRSGGTKGLPVNGVIVMTQYWSVAFGAGSGWRHYSGVPHVSHWHVSGLPRRVVGLGGV